MKKLIVTIIISLVCINSFACGPFERVYLAKDYNMFRICGDDMQGDLSLTADAIKMRKDNCIAWARLTSINIPIDDIDNVVYKWNLGKIHQLKNAIKKNRKYNDDNKFASWLYKHKDDEILDFLILAKRCEKVGETISNPWYYKYEDDEESQTLKEIINEAKSYKGKRLKNRYSLQTLRASFYLEAYQDIIDYYKSNRSVFYQMNVITKMSLGYIAGAYYHLNDKKEALKLYLKIDELSDAYLCADTKLDFNSWIYAINPDNDFIFKRLQHQINLLEAQQHHGDLFDTRSEYLKVNRFVNKLINENRISRKAELYYAAAFINDKLNNQEQANKYIALAKNCPANKDLENSIRVLSIYLKCRNTNYYTNEFENELYPDLVWLDNQIKSNLNRDVINKIAEFGFSCSVCGISNYYWNDMMRKIVIGYVSPLCIKSNKKVRALQYLNMADNRIFNLVNKVTITNRYTSQNDSIIKLPDLNLSIKEYRKSSELFNKIDYVNDYFINLDSFDANTVITYANKLMNPTDAVDTFLTERSYTNPEYLYDIIETKLIADMKYSQAIGYLKAVSPEFNISRNVYKSCNYDPFTNKLLKTKDPQYKLHFAQEMTKLQKQFSTSANPNDKAEAMLKYAKGIQNSLGNHCWPLTSYYWGYFYPYDFYTKDKLRLIQKSLQKSESIKKQAFAMFTDDERAAKAYYDWKMFKTVVNKYKNTQTAKFIRGKCDKLYDYKVQPILPPACYGDKDNMEY